jgi:hypothetical protein
MVAALRVGWYLSPTDGRIDSNKIGPGEAEAPSTSNRA